MTMVMRTHKIPLLLLFLIIYLLTSCINPISGERIHEGSPGFWKDLIRRTTPSYYSKHKPSPPPPPPKSSPPPPPPKSSPPKPVTPSPSMINKDQVPQLPPILPNDPPASHHDDLFHRDVDQTFDTPFESPTLQEKAYQDREKRLLQQRIKTAQRQTSYHARPCLGTQSVEIPRGCPNETVHIMSFPKSGRTWLRCLVTSMGVANKNNNPFDYPIVKLDQKLYAHEFSHGHPHPYFHTPRTISNLSDDQYLPNKPVIYLGRDPRDVAISNYHEVINRHAYRFFEPENIEVVKNMTFSQFLRFYKGSFLTNVAMMNTWARYRGGSCPRLILYYENLHAEDCWKNEFQKLALFLGYFLSKQQLKDVRHRCSFEYLKEEIANKTIEEAGKEEKIEETLEALEALRGKKKKNQQEREQRIKLKREKEKFEANHLNRRWTSEDTNDPASAKVRKGKVGGYLEEVSHEDARWMEEHAFFVGEFLEYDSRYRGTVKMTEREMVDGVAAWKD